MVAHRGCNNGGPGSSPGKSKVFFPLCLQLREGPGFPTWWTCLEAWFSRCEFFRVCWDMGFDLSGFSDRKNTRVVAGLPCVSYCPSHPLGAGETRLVSDLRTQVLKCHWAQVLKCGPTLGQPGFSARGGVEVSCWDSSWRVKASKVWKRACSVMVAHRGCNNGGPGSSPGKSKVFFLLWLQLGEGPGIPTETYSAQQEITESKSN